MACVGGGSEHACVEGGKREEVGWVGDPQWRNHTPGLFAWKRRSIPLRDDLHSVTAHGVLLALCGRGRGRVGGRGVGGFVHARELVPK